MILAGSDPSRIDIIHHLVDSPTVAMQQHNARIGQGRDPRELITLEPEAAQRFIRELG